MSVTFGPSQTILNAVAADVTQANATWYSTNQADLILVDVVITGTANAHIDYDYYGNNAASLTTDVNTTNHAVISNPNLAKQIRAYCNNCAANESVVVKMQEIYYNRR